MPLDEEPDKQAAFRAEEADKLRGQAAACRRLSGTAKIKHVLWQALSVAAVEQGKPRQLHLRRPIRLPGRVPLWKQADGKLRRKRPSVNAADGLQVERSAYAVYMTPNEQIRCCFQQAPVQFDDPPRSPARRMECARHCRGRAPAQDQPRHDDQAGQGP